MSLCQGDQELFLSNVSLLTHPFPHGTLWAPVSLGCSLVRSKQEFWGEENRWGLTAESPYLFNLKAVARRLPRGAGNISGSQMALPPAPVLRADSQSSIPGLSQGEPSLLHSALLLPSISSLSGDALLPSFHGHETFPAAGGSQGGKGAAAGGMGSSRAPAPCPPPAAPSPRQQPPSRGKTERRTG